MPRLFVAVDVPDAIKDQLVALCSGVPGAKWVQRAQLHLTLRFIGEVDSTKFQQTKTALGDVRSESFWMALRGVGQFPPKRAARVLWVGVDAPPTLHQLQAQVEATLNRLDFAPEERPFSAHLTLARLKTVPPPSAVESFLSRHTTFQSESFPITAFILYSSILSPQGPTYQREAVYPLSE
jgi:2'-5' RNA ligase